MNSQTNSKLYLTQRQIDQHRKDGVALNSIEPSEKPKRQKRNLNIWCARFSLLKLRAFGLDQILDFATDIEIYQARIHPELWKARPTLRRAQHTWEAPSAEALMDLIASDFETCLRPWEEYLPRPTRPTLANPTCQPEKARKASGGAA